jgi:hypothetical protein
MGLTRPPTEAALSSVVFKSFALSVWLSATLTAALAIPAAFTGCAPNSAPDAVTAPPVVGVVYSRLGCPLVPNLAKPVKSPVYL